MVRTRIWRADDQIINTRTGVAKTRDKILLGRRRTRWRDSVMKDLKTLQAGVQIDMAYNIEENGKSL